MVKLLISFPKEKVFNWNVLTFRWTMTGIFLRCKEFHPLLSCRLPKQRFSIGICDSPENCFLERLMSSGYLRGDTTSSTTHPYFENNPQAMFRRPGFLSSPIMHCISANDLLMLMPLHAMEYIFNVSTAPSNAGQPGGFFFFLNKFMKIIFFS